MNTKDRLIDLVENTEPNCILRIDKDVYYCNIDGDIADYGCELTLRWRNQDCEVSATVTYCTINPAYKGIYDIDTFTVKGTPDDWEYQLGTDTVSADDEEAIKALMEEKMCWYAFHRDGYTIEHI